MRPYSDDEMIGFALLFPLGEGKPDGSDSDGHNIEAVCMT